MDPAKYGKIIGKETNDANINTFYITNDKNIFKMEINDNINNVHIMGAADIKWVDTKLSDNSFKRVIGKNTLYIKDGDVIVKSKQLNAKPFRKVVVDQEIIIQNIL